MESLELPDLQLAVTAIWVYAQLLAFRQAVNEKPRTPLNTKSSTLLVVATLNREYAVVTNRMLREMKRDYRKGAASLEYVPHRSIGKGDEPFQVDAVRSWTRPSMPQICGCAKR